MDFDEVLLLPHVVEEWVGPDHLARFVREFVVQLDLSALGFKSHDKKTGRRGYENALLLRAWLYGFLTRQRSTRKLERASSNDMGAIWLTGNEQPDHSTLSGGVQSLARLNDSGAKGEGEGIDDRS